MRGETHTVIKAIREKGMHGAYLDSHEFGKHCSIAKWLVDTHGYTRVMYVIEHGTDVWPFTADYWDVFDLKRHWPRAYTQAVKYWKEQQRQAREVPDLHQLLRSEERHAG